MHFGCNGEEGVRNSNATRNIINRRPLITIMYQPKVAIESQLKLRSWFLAHIHKLAKLQTYQQKPNNRILLLPFINGSQAQKVRLLHFWHPKDTIYFSERNLEKTYNEKIRFMFLSKEFINDVSDDSNTKLLKPYV